MFNLEVSVYCISRIAALRVCLKILLGDCLRIMIVSSSLCVLMLFRFGEFLYAQLSLKSTAADSVFSSLEKDAKRYDRLDSVNRAHLLDRVWLHIIK